MATVNGAAVAAVTAKVAAAPAKLIAGFPNHALGTKVELLLNGTWTDITHYVLVRDDIQISPFGRTNETSQMDTSSMTLTLKNIDGRFTPDNTSGAYYPYVQLNTQIRVSIIDTSVTNVTYQGYRFWGEVSEWPPQWDVTGHDVYVQITASGVWRRLSQRTSSIGSPYTRFNNTLNGSYNLAAFWPMEDGQGSQYFATTTPATAGNMTISGPPTNVPTLASVSGFSGSDALPTLNAAELDGTVTTSSNPTTNQLRFCLFVPSGGDTGRGTTATTTAPATIARMHTSGTVATVDIGFGSPIAGGPLCITGLSASGTKIFTGNANLNIWGIPMLVIANLSQVGGNIVWDLNTILPGGTTWNSTVTGTLNTATVDDVTSVIFNPGGTFNTVSVGQAALYYGNPPILSTADALNGWAGENAMNRFRRLCAEEGIPVETIGSSATTMGVQADDTISNILQEIETTDGGLIYETRDQFGLGYRSMSSLQNQSVATTLDYSAKQVGQSLQPVVDDALTRNDITLTSNYDGYSVRVYLANGARSLQNPPNGVGTGYEANITVNSTNHTQVNNLGIQLLNCGTVATSRYPSITANMARTTVAPLFSSIPALRQGDCLQVTNLPVFGGASTQKQLVWGWTETINNYTWTIAFNTIPEAPWESSFNPGTSVSGTVPASPTTQGGAGGTGSVTSAMIVEGAIIGSNIAAGAVQGGNIANAAITATNIAAATITGSLIANGAITGSNIGTATIQGNNIAAGTITGGPGGNIASATITGTEIGAGTITGGAGGNIASASITGSNIGSGTITGGTGGNIASASITATNIVNGTITATQISGAAGINGGQIASGTITATNIQSATITNSQIATGTITGSNIAGGTITNANIQNATITNVQIAGGTITNSNISPTAGITGSQLANSTITSVQISNGTITTTQISPTAGILGSQLSSSAGITAGQVSFTASAIGGIGATLSSTAPSSPHTNDLWFDGSNGNELKQWNGTAWVAFQYGTNAIAASSVTASLIAANAVVAGKIAANAVTTGTIAAGVVTATQIAANTITASNIASGAITATLMAANSIAAGNIQSGAITAGKIAAGAIDGMTITGANIVADGANGQFLIYDGTPAGGNLIGSWSGQSGTDSFGNAYPGGLSVQTGVITGLDIDSVNITNATLQGDILNGSSIANPAITGGTMTETNLVFDQTGGQLLVYTSTTTQVLLTTANNGVPWVVPAGVSSAKVECWGAGAGGDGGSTSQGGNGAGGGEYACEPNFNLTPGDSVNFQVGAGGTGNNTGGGHGTDGGDTFFSGVGGVLANGGLGNGTGGTGSGNTIHHNGGSGGSGSTSGGAGSGGNSANATAAGNNGNNASSSTGAAAPSTQTGSGHGGAGGSNAANGSSGTSPGGGGGGAGKGTSTSSKTISYAPLYTGSYYGPDATSNANQLRTQSVAYQGGETASGGAANGNQRSVFGFNRALMTSDFSGYTITSCQLQLKNLHSWYSTGMTWVLDEYAGLPGTVPSTYPAGNLVSNDLNGTIAEGDTHVYSIPTSIAARFAGSGSTSNGLGIGEWVAGHAPYNLNYYGYFDPSQTRFSITGTISGAGNETAGNGGDGQILITYTSGRNFLCAISPTATSDSFGNAFAAGYTGPVNVPDPNNATLVEGWHNLTLKNGWQVQGFARYKLIGYNLMLVECQLNSGTGPATNANFADMPTGYSASQSQFPCLMQFVNTSGSHSLPWVVQIGTGAGGSMNILEWTSAAQAGQQLVGSFFISLD